MTGIRKIKVQGLEMFEVVVRGMVMTRCFSKEAANTYILRMIAKLNKNVNN